MEKDLLANKVRVLPHEFDLPERRDTMLEEWIASKDYRKFVEEKSIQISDGDMATLIYNNFETPYYVKMDTLEKLAEDTKDMDLKKQIMERLAYNKECMQKFRENTPNAYYRLEIAEHARYDEYGIYLSYDAAYKGGLKAEEAFRITRECFACKDDLGENEGVFGMVDFSKDGQVLEAASFWKEDGAIDAGDKNRFEGRGVELPLLFRCGDIVKVIGRDIWGIVEAPKDEEEENKMKKLAAVSDYSDFQIPVDFVFVGEDYQTIFAHDHIPPTNLEFLELDDEDTRKGFLVYMSNAVKNGSMLGGGPRQAGRMQEVLRRIEAVWKQYPDMRLGQLLVNVCGPKDLFLIEDEHLMQLIEKNRFGRNAL